MGILAPIEWVVAWIVYGSHRFFTLLGLPDGPGLAWILSIIALTIVIRLILVPLFVKQIKASRGMQMMQPDLQEIQKKYKDKKDQESREAMTRETMELYKKHGANPFSSCLPILIQSPIFLALFRVLTALPQIADGTRGPIGPINQALAQDFQSSSLFGAHLSDVFRTTQSTEARVVVVILIILMTATMFLGQRQLTMKNMPATAMEGPAASSQKMMLYAMPVMFAISGVNFPVGVLIYWTVSQLWSMGQQFYTIKRMPAPGSEAEREFLSKKKPRKRIATVTTQTDNGIIAESIQEDSDELVEVTLPGSGQRIQPQRKNRKKKG